MMRAHSNSLSAPRLIGRRCILKGGLATAAAVTVLRSPMARAAVPLKVQLGWTKNVESAGHFAALKLGYFAKEGLDVTLAPGGPQIDPVALLASGAVDLAMVTSPLSVLAARSRGVPIVVLGCGAMKSPLGLAARADKRIKLPEGLKGAKIGYQQVNRNLLNAMLKANKVAQEDITTTVVTGDPSMLIEGRIDLMTVSVLNVPLAMQQRGVEAKSWLAYDLGVPLQGAVVACLESTLAARREQIGGFLNALGRGWAYDIEHPDEVTGWVVSDFGEGLNLDHQKAYNRGQIPLISTEITKAKGLFWIEQSTWDVANSVATDTGLIGAPVDLSKLLMFAALEGAHMPKV